MFNQKQLQQLKLLLVVAEREVDYMPVEDIRCLKKIVDAESCKQQVEDFEQYVTDLMPAAADDDEAWQQFNDLQWTISIGDKSLTLINQATIYNAISEMLAELYYIYY